MLALARGNDTAESTLLQTVEYVHIRLLFIALQAVYHHKLAVETFLSCRRYHRHKCVDGCACYVLLVVYAKKQHILASLVAQNYRQWRLGYGYALSIADATRYLLPLVTRASIVSPVIAYCNEPLKYICPLVSYLSAFCLAFSIRLSCCSPLAI